MNVNECLSQLRGLLGNLPAVEAVQECHQILQDWPDDDFSGYTIARTLVDTAMLQRASEAATTLQAIGAFFPESVPASLIELHFTERPAIDQIRDSMALMRKAIDAIQEGKGPQVVGTPPGCTIRSHVILPSAVMAEQEGDDNPS